GPDAQLLDGIEDPQARRGFGGLRQRRRTRPPERDLEDERREDERGADDRKQQGDGRVDRAAGEPERTGPQGGGKQSGAQAHRQMSGHERSDHATASRGGAAPGAFAAVSGSTNSNESRMGSSPEMPSS